MSLMLLLLLAGLEHQFWENEQPNYCGCSYQADDLVGHARKQVFYQDKALNDLKVALNNVTNPAIALVGSSGVGKSLTAKVLREQFPWPEQVKTLSWRDTPHLSGVMSVVKNTSSCGQSLILIDDMRPEDVRHVVIINKLILEQKEIDNGLEKLTIIYIFTVNSKRNQKYEKEMQKLRKLKDTHVVIFKEISQFRQEIIMDF